MPNMPRDDWSDFAKEAGPDTRQPDMVSAAKADRNGWLPIESAPRDGTEIILYHPPEMFKGKQYPERVTCGAWAEWTETASEYHASTGVYLGQSIQGGGAEWSSWDGGFREDSPPTHWQPLPAPPEDAE